VLAVRLPTPSELRSGLAYTFLNFATPIAFYLTFHWFGAKSAIGFGVGVTFVQLLVHWVYRLKFSPFFLLASGFLLAFGILDLFLQTPRFFRLEPFVQNFVIASAFLITVFMRIPLITHFAGALPKKFRPNLSSPAAIRYLRKLTLIWAVYLYSKAALFLYLAFQVNLGDLILLRSVLGGGTLLLMIGGELAYRHWFRPIP